METSCSLARRIQFIGYILTINFHYRYLMSNVLAISTSLNTQISGLIRLHYIKLIAYTDMNCNGNITSDNT